MLSILIQDITIAKDIITAIIDLQFLYKNIVFSPFLILFVKYITTKY